MRVMHAFGRVDVLGGWCQGRLKARAASARGGRAAGRQEANGAPQIFRLLLPIAQAPALL